MIYLWVALGGALGSVARYWIAMSLALLTGAEFPWGTLLINVVGSFVISFFGMLTGGNLRLHVPNEARVFVTVGLCGGFTTFSSFSIQTVELFKTGETGRAALYVAASVILCLASCALGFIAATTLGNAIGTARTS